MFTFEIAQIARHALPTLLDTARKMSLALIVALTALTYSNSSFAAGTSDQQSACMGDAFRLCGSEIPNVDRITICMKKNFTQLSPGCRAQFK